MKKKKTDNVTIYIKWENLIICVVLFLIIIIAYLFGDNDPNSAYFPW